MHQVNIPEDILVSQVDGSPVEGAKPISMFEFVCGLLSDPKAVKDFDSLVKSMKVREAFKNAAPLNSASGKVAMLEDTDWEHACAIAKLPTGGYTANAYSLRKFIDALLEAKSC